MKIWALWTSMRCFLTAKPPSLVWHSNDVADVIVVVVACLSGLFGEPP